MTPPPKPPQRYRFLHGFILVMLVHGLALAFAARSNFLISMSLIGLFQLLYVIPIVIVAFVRGETGLAQGALVAAGVTFLLNGIYCASILGAFRHR